MMGTGERKLQMRIGYPVCLECGPEPSKYRFPGRLENAHAAVVSPFGCALKLLNHQFSAFALSF